jgi:hypothetical protein
MSKKQPEVSAVESMILEGKDFVISPSGEIRSVTPSTDCVVSYIDCKTKKRQAVSLKPGDTFAYQPVVEAPSSQPQ